MQALTFRLLKCQQPLLSSFLYTGAEQAVGYQDKDTWSIFSTSVWKNLNALSSF